LPLGGTELKAHGTITGKICALLEFDSNFDRLAHQLSDGRNASERVHNRWIADVATINDEVRVAKRIKRYRPNQTVGI